MQNRDAILSTMIGRSCVFDTATSQQQRQVSVQDTEFDRRLAGSNGSSQQDPSRRYRASVRCRSAIVECQILAKPRPSAAVLKDGAAAPASLVAFWLWHRLHCHTLEMCRQN